MNKLSYDDVDELQAGLRHRTDLGRFIPYGETMMTEAAWCFWRDALPRLRRGEWADFITAIERRFEPRGTVEGDVERLLPKARRAA